VWWRLTSWMRLSRNGTIPAAKLNADRCSGSTFCSVYASWYIFSPLALICSSLYTINAALFHRYLSFFQWLGSRVASVLDSGRVQIAAATLLGNSLRQTVHTINAKKTFFYFFNWSRFFTFFYFPNVFKRYF